MLDKNKLKQFLLSNFPNARLASGGKEVVIRCPFCGDSQKDMRDAHFYIGLQEEYDFENNQSPPKYHCFLCNKGGILTGELLLQMLDYSTDEESLICDLNILANKYSSTKTTKSKLFTKYNYTTIGCIEKTSLDLEKLDYINNRLGINLTIDQALQDKIVFNLLYFLNYNGITKINIPNNEVDTISNYFIGFLSIDNSSILFRKCSNNENIKSLKRYKKYKIISNDIEGFNYYCLPTKINSMSTDPIHIHVAEGPFDILSICYNLNHNNRDNQIYISAGGKSYYNAVYTIITILKLSPNIVIHVYPDNDVLDKIIRLNFKKFTDVGISVYIHRNIFEGEKDFGVRMDRINNSYIKI